MIEHFNGKQQRASSLMLGQYVKVRWNGLAQDKLAAAEGEIS